MNYYVARDKNGNLNLFNEIPFRSAYTEGTWIGYSIKVDNDFFPELTWDDEPKQINLNLEDYVEDFNLLLEPINDEQESTPIESAENVHQEE